MALTLKHLGYFLALSRERHFGRAADVANVTQPALSMQIRDLEDRLGCALIERGREIRLTPAGRSVAERAARILAEVADIEAMARRKTLGGRINVGFIPTVAPYILPHLLPKLTLELGVHEAQTHALLTKLADGSLDAAVIATPPPPGLHGRPLFEDRFLLAGNRRRMAGLSARIEALRPAHLDPDHLLLLDEGHCLADQALAVCGLGREESRLALGASSLSTLSGLVAQGMGLTFLPEISIAVETAAQPAIRLARFADPQPSRQIMLVGTPLAATEGWFDDLSAALQAAAQTISAMPRVALPDDR
ncbi:LysR substrate-binding domain-containing protein [Falsirhodobacter halotolerans]|uniref:LysR substrate-binding domain-containing protein n=1 Tax=Falsirhodobacter halotolerans TaxID=1146892 RepID=UPI001FD5A42F|nr:LysR substrate-binding domain-containing protein [Falsirhodobacter halotolerans]MCJ8141282.1 LysR substrate-binding domain-containing protein [Falsirhodobacter halotolerans]